MGPWKAWVMPKWGKIPAEFEALRHDKHSEVGGEGWSCGQLVVDGGVGFFGMITSMKIHESPHFKRKIVVQASFF